MTLYLKHYVKSLEVLQEIIKSKVIRPKEVFNDKDDNDQFIAAYNFYNNLYPFEVDNYDKASSVHFYAHAAKSIEYYMKTMGKGKVGAAIPIVLSIEIPIGFIADTTASILEKIAKTAGTTGRKYDYISGKNNNFINNDIITFSGNVVMIAAEVPISYVKKVYFLDKEMYKGYVKAELNIPAELYNSGGDYSGDYIPSIEVEDSILSDTKKIIFTALNSVKNKILPYGISMKSGGRNLSYRLIIIVIFIFIIILMILIMAELIKIS